jgi:hypothetical protein
MLSPLPRTIPTVAFAIHPSLIDDTNNAALELMNMLTVACPAMRGRLPGYVPPPVWIRTALVSIYGAPKIVSHIHANQTHVTPLVKRLLFP